jgi:nickel-dependent lactate racemase
MARHDFILDVTMTQERAISGVFAGDPVKAHAAGVAFLETTSLERLSGLADAVITSAAGYPLDLTFYQIAKGTTAAQHIVKPGGPILTIGECAEGIGSPAYAAMLRDFKGYEHYLESIRTTPVVNDQWQLEKVALAGLKNRLLFYAPGVRGPELGALGDCVYPDLEAAVAAALEGLPRGARVALVPDGPYVYARAFALAASVA